MRIAWPHTRPSPWARAGTGPSTAGRRGTRVGRSSTQPPGRHLGYPIVEPVETGNDGVTASISKRSDVALADHKCPILPNKALGAERRPAPEPGRAGGSPDKVEGLPRPRRRVSRRRPPERSGRRRHQLDAPAPRRDGFPHTGLGMDLDQALEPAYVEVAGLKVAFVSWNEVTGPTHAGPTTPGVAWLEQANVDAAVGRARGRRRRPGDLRSAVVGRRRVPPGPVGSPAGGRGLDGRGRLRPGHRRRPAPDRAACSSASVRMA